MKKLLWTLLLTLPLCAQDAPPGFNPGGNGGTIQYVQTAPSGACGYFSFLPIVMLTGQIYTCANGAWTLQGSGSGSFTALTGDATSTNTGGNTTVIGLLGHRLPSLSNGFLSWNGSAWVLTSSGVQISPLTLNNSGAGAPSGTAFNGLSALILSWNTLGAQQALTVTTTGTSGPSTLSGGVLNIPQYTGGGGGGGAITIVAPSGDTTGATDGAAIQAQCVSSSAVQLEGGTYYVGHSNSVITLAAPCKIQGVGKATVIQNEGTTNDIFRVSYYTLWQESPWVYPNSTNQTEISNLQLVQDSAVTPTAGYGFDIGSGITQSGGVYSYTMNVHVHDVVMNSLWGGFYVQSDELYIGADAVIGRNFVGGGCVYYAAEVGSGDNHWGPNLECSGLTNSGITITQSDYQSFLGVKLNGSGIKFTGASATKSVIFNDVSIETGISQACMMDFGTGSQPTNIQFTSSEQYGFAEAFCHPANAAGFAFSFNNSSITSDYVAGLISNGGYTTVAFPTTQTYQDLATFAGSANTLLSSYTTQAGKTFALYTADGVTPQAMPVLSGSNYEQMASGQNADYGDVLDTLTPASANYTVSETFTLASSSDQVAVFGRAVSGVNTNYVCLYGGATNNLTIYAQVAGAATLLTSYTFVWGASATHTLALTMSGSTISCTIDGNQIFGSPLTNTFISAAGQAGSRVQGFATGTNFFVQ